MPEVQTAKIVVPLFAPASDVVTRIAQLTQQAPVIAVDDGSPIGARPVLEELAKLERVDLLRLPANHGIAAALNHGITAAFQHDADSVITFDQDSTPEPDHVTRLARHAANTACLGVIGPALIEARHTLDPTADGVMDVEDLIQSGMLIPRRTWEVVGPFDEGLFIDFVDIDFCRRVHRAGLRVLIDPTLPMQHRLGDPHGRQLPPLAGRRPRSSHHGPDRRYYINRNLIHMVRRYHRDYPDWVRSMVRGVLKSDLLALLVDDQKLAKVKAMGYGLYDGLCGRVGRRDQRLVARR